MIENCFRNLEKGMTPFRAAIEGAQQIGFTVLAISISLVAAFIPLLFMSGVVGRVFREFSVTLAFAIAVSTAVSLTLTPMICAHFVRKPPSPDATWLDRAVEWVLGVMVRGYARSLAVVLNYRALTLLIMAATVVITGMFYARTPKGYFPQDDTGLIWGGTQASTEVSFQAMYDLQQKAEAIARADPAVANIGSSIGTSGFSASVNRGSLFISLKPLAERGGLSAQAVATRLRLKTADIPGLRVFFFPMQDVRVGGRQSDSSYQYTLWDTDYNELLQWAPRVFAKIQTVPGLVERYLARTNYDAQQADHPVDPNRRDNLFEPVPGDAGAHGRFDDESHGRSPYTFLATHRGAVGLGVLAGGVGYVARRLLR
jgi:multidrug efflux pump